jgi:predicted N-acetyltransferase YhbS
MTYEVVHLRQQPQHLKTVAEWIHRQWWSNTNTPVQSIEQWLADHLGEEEFPTSFIAVSDGVLAGSVSLHETEAEDRPAYWPYLGALFVKPDHRRRGLGEMLVRAVEAHASHLGHPALYLNAADAVTDFYRALGWEIVEREYGRKRLNIMRRLLERTGDQPRNN